MGGRPGTKQRLGDGRLCCCCPCLQRPAHHQPTQPLTPSPLPSPCPQVREWIGGVGVENIGKRLVNSREGKVEFDKPSMPLATLMHYGERAGVQRPSWGVGICCPPC